ncbi:DNA repair protein RAD51 [Halocaridina rubra]|uniref:DNA repair protein RAD51 n=1 Tax=Halocaridina rubra TaxID=373956 RepID=A0AAN8X7G7_HALRR
MALFKRLSTLSVSQELKDAAKRTNLKTVKDVLSLAPLQVMEMLHLSSEECNTFMNLLYSLCIPPQLSAFGMLEEEERGCVKLGSHQLDAMLHGGLPACSITEFAGPAGVGKTQWCLHSAVRAVVQEACGGRNASVIYIDTEMAFRPERVVEILSSSYPDCKSDISIFLSKIFLYQPATIKSLTDILESLEVLAVEKDIGLIIVDSIASLARKEIAPGLSKSNFMRTNQLATWVAKLKSIAQLLGICVVVTNQVTTKFRKSEVQVTEDLHGEECEETEAMSGTQTGKTLQHVMPALGNTWAHFVNTRIILQYLPANQRQMIIAKSPVAPFSSFSYSIGEWGIKIHEHESAYTYSGCDPSLLRIGIQQGITT